MPDTEHPDDGIGILFVAEVEGDIHDDNRIAILADNTTGGSPWTVAMMEVWEDPLRDVQFAHRLVRCFEACRGVSDADLAPGCVTALRARIAEQQQHLEAAEIEHGDWLAADADRSALLAMLIRDWPVGGFIVRCLPVMHQGFYKGGKRLSDGSDAWHFDVRADAEAAALWAARRAKGEDASNK